MAQMSIDDFKACCRASITRDNQLVVACKLANGQRFSRTIPLGPIIANVKAMIADYHRRVLHGKMDDTTISGLGDWFNSAVDAVKSVAHSKAVKDIYNAIDAHKKEIAMGVAAAAGGPAAAAQVNQAFTAYDQMTKASAGDPAALQQVKNVADASAAGNPKADDLMAMMRAMKNMLDAKDAKAQGTAVSGRKHTGHRGGWGKGITATGAKPGDRKTIHRTQQDPNNIASVDKWGSPANQPQQGGGSDGGGGDGGGGDGGGYDEGDDYDDDQDQDMGKNHGWLYNRPYRVSAPHPIGPSLRMLYALGAG